MHITWKNHTIQNVIINVKITFLYSDFSRIDVEVVNTELEKSMMLITMDILPIVKGAFKVDLGEFVLLLCKKYQSFNPSNNVRYCDKTSEDNIRCPKEWVKIVRLDHKHILIHGNMFDLKSFIIEIPLDFHL